MNDRWAVLARRAAARGVLDYRDYRRRDGKFLYREALIFQELEQEALAGLYELRALQLAVLAASPKFREDALFSQLEDVWRRLRRIRFPYIRSREEELSDKMTSYRKQWEAVFGSLQDPQVLQQVRQAADRLRPK